MKSFYSFTRSHLFADLNFSLPKNKEFELQLEVGKHCPTNDLFKFNVQLSSKQDHAGFIFEFCLFRMLFLMLSIYDNRHWDFDNDCWKK
jgi:hypothetical protein